LCKNLLHAGVEVGLGVAAGADAVDGILVATNDALAGGKSQFGAREGSGVWPYNVKVPQSSKWVFILYAATQSLGLHQWQVTDKIDFGTCVKVPTGDAFNL
jgi:hypothetical protein